MFKDIIGNAFVYILHYLYYVMILYGYTRRYITSLKYVIHNGVPTNVNAVDHSVNISFRCT